MLLLFILGRDSRNDCAVQLRYKHLIKYDKSVKENMNEIEENVEKKNSHKMMKCHEKDYFHRKPSSFRISKGSFHTCGNTRLHPIPNPL